MSSILDALKKLEDEKQKESRRRNADFPLNQAILNEGGLSGNMVKKTGSGWIAITMAIILAGGGIAVWTLSSHRADKTVQKPVNAQPELKEVVVVPPPASAFVSQNNQKETGSGRQAKPKIVQPARLNSSAASAPQKPDAAEVVIQQDSPKRPVLRVMGIAYNDSGANSVAIVNGTPVSVGAQIDGAKVEEILKDKVRFSYGGERFDVMLAR